jgi:hypothetical protein
MASGYILAGRKCVPERDIFVFNGRGGNVGVTSGGDAVTPTLGCRERAYTWASIRIADELDGMRGGTSGSGA